MPLRPFSTKYAVMLSCGRWQSTHSRSRCDDSMNVAFSIFIAWHCPQNAGEPENDSPADVQTEKMTPAAKPPMMHFSVFF